MDPRISSNNFNISGLRCAAEYLEMTEDLEEGNLIFKTEAFLSYVVLSSRRLHCGAQELRGPLAVGREPADRAPLQRVHRMEGVRQPGVCWAYIGATSGRLPRSGASTASPR
ncbi:Root phototropism protein 3 [Hordeum vulgare]|nr:Root phototropism protein 3 [Hordeum vulgare]